MRFSPHRNLGPKLRGMSLTTSAKHADRLPVPQWRGDKKCGLGYSPFLESCMGLLMCAKVVVIETADTGGRCS
ncbi:hypothetical protein H5A44_04785 [Pectobacterium brasiliense]|nr:hypothetical protein [Pectobacterium brasiliense]